MHNPRLSSKSSSFQSSDHIAARMDIIHLIILFLFFTSLFSKSTSSKNDKYDICSTNFSCGDKDDLGYPFYDGSSPYDYCGYPGFNLTCIPESPPKITISGQDYYLKNAEDTDKYSITISRTDRWLGQCPDRLNSTTMDFSKFNLSSTNQNITFFYGCQESYADLSSRVPNATCDGGYGSLHGFYLTQKMVDKYNKSLNLFKNCNYIFIPVSKSKAEAVDGEPGNWGVLINAFEEGFDLGLIVDNSACDSCMKSKGVCGYDYDSKKFVCHCDDQDYNLQCGVENKGFKHKRPLLIGKSDIKKDV
ncbi:hypothetical protein V2J09_012646 [Rumex salicifolius]